MEKLSHAYIISSSSKEEREKLSLYLAQKMLCSDKAAAPCGVCRNCRKVKNGTHPDLTHIMRLTDDKGRPKKELQVDQIRAMGADAYVLPNEADAKVYIIDEAETMNERAQNAALKILEEPPRGVHFILCTDNPEKLLVTVRSRCTELHRNGNEVAFTSEARKEAAEFIRCVGSGSASKLLTLCMGSESADNAHTAEFLEATKAQLIGILKGSEVGSTLSGRRCMELISLCDHCLELLKVNTGTKHIYGLLAVKGIEEKS